VRTSEIVSNIPLLLAGASVSNNQGSSPYLQQFSSALKAPLTKVRKSGSELSIFKYALYWMLRFNPWDKIPEAREALTRISVLQSSITSTAALEDLLGKTPKQIEALFGWEQTKGLFFGTMKWLNSCSLTALKLNTFGMLGKLPTPVYNIFVNIYSMTFMLLSSKSVRENLKDLKDEPLESGKLYRLVDSVNSLALGILYVFFYSTCPREVLALETADVGLSFTKRNISLVMRSADKLCSYYLPGKMRAYT
jgi:hypothetical protein